MVVIPYHFIFSCVFFKEGRSIAMYAADGPC